MLKNGYIKHGEQKTKSYHNTGWHLLFIPIISFDQTFLSKRKVWLHL
jgi:hypothetical protein